MATTEASAKQQVTFLPKADNVNDPEAKKILNHYRDWMIAMFVLVVVYFIMIVVALSYAIPAYQQINAPPTPAPSG